MSPLLFKGTTVSTLLEQLPIKLKTEVTLISESPPNKISVPSSPLHKVPQWGGLYVFVARYI